MAVETICMTNGAVYTTEIHSRGVKVDVRWSAHGREIFMSNEEARLLDDLLHNQVELAVTAVLGEVFRRDYGPT